MYRKGRKSMKNHIGKKVFIFLFAVIATGILCTDKRVEAQAAEIFPDNAEEQIEEPVKAKATDSGVCKDGLNWELTSDGTLTIRGNGPMGSALDGENAVISPWKDYCEQITKVVLENGVTSVGEYAFSSRADVAYSNLSSVIFPDSVTNLNMYAFRGCSSLTELVLNEGLETIEMGALSSTGLTEITIPSTVTNIDISNQTVIMGTPFGGESLASINVKEGNITFSSDNGVLYNKEKTSLLCYPCGKEETQFIVPSSVSNIASGAFCKCSHLEKIVLPEGVESMASFVFFNSASLREVIVKSSIMSGGYGSFENCKDVKVTILDRACNMDELMLYGDITICGYPGSTAQTFARKSNLSFVALNGDGEACVHTDVSVLKKKATTSENGSIIKTCKKCGKTLSETVIYYPESVVLSAKRYTYNGKVRKPLVTIKGSNGNEIKSSNYQVSYSSGCKNVGKYTVKIAFKGNYSGTIKKNFIIRVKDSNISQIKVGTNRMVVKWKKQIEQTTGYKIQYSEDRAFQDDSTKIITVNKNQITAQTISRLKAETKYYVRVCTYKTVKQNGQSIEICSKWSKAKTVTTKK